MLLDKKKVGIVTKVGAVIVALAFIAVYIPTIYDIAGSGNNSTQTAQTAAQAAQRIASLEEQVKKDPKSVEGWIQLGNAYYDYEKLTGDKNAAGKAIESYQKALELDPKRVSVRVDMATKYFSMGQVETATAEAQKAIETDPKFANAYFNLGVFLNAQGKNNEAIAAYEKYLELEPKGEGADLAKERIGVLKKSVTDAIGGSSNK